MWQILIFVHSYSIRLFHLKIKLLVHILIALDPGIFVRGGGRVGVVQAQLTEISSDNVCFCFCLVLNLFYRGGQWFISRKMVPEDPTFSRDAQLFLGVGESHS